MSRNRDQLGEKAQETMAEKHRKTLDLCVFWIERAVSRGDFTSTFPFWRNCEFCWSGIL
jgi:hypothetical protein